MSQTPSKNKNLIFIIAVLLLTNIAVLAYFLWFKDPGPKSHNAGGRGNGNGMTEMLQKEVGFNDSQLTQYKELRDQQRQVLRPMYDDMRKAKDSLFRLMGNSAANDSMINNIANAIGEKQKSLDLQTFNHFKRIRALCVSPEQMVKYDSAVLKMFSKMGKPAKRADGDKEEKRKQ